MWKNSCQVSHKNKKKNKTIKRNGTVNEKLILNVEKLER